MSLRIFKAFLLIFFTISLLSGCIASNIQPSIHGTSPAINSSPLSSIQDNTPLATPTTWGNRASLSRAPKPGETAEFTYTLGITDEAVRLYGQKLANSRAWIDFSWINIKGSYSEAKRAVPVPLSEALVSGEPNWEGNALENRTGKVISCKLQLPREGIWRINVYFSIDGWDIPMSGYLPVAVVDGTAAIMGTKEFESGRCGENCIVENATICLYYPTLFSN